MIDKVSLESASDSHLFELAPYFGLILSKFHEGFGLPLKNLAFGFSIHDFVLLSRTFFDSPMAFDLS